MGAPRRFAGGSLRSTPAASARIHKPVRALIGGHFLTRHEWDIASFETLRRRHEKGRIEVRKALPPGTIEVGTQMPEALHAVLARSGLGGLIYVSAPPGDGPARDRISLWTIDTKADVVEAPEDEGT